MSLWLSMLETLKRRDRKSQKRDISMTKKRYPLLKAVEHNWGLIGPGHWTKVKWLISPDGSYEVVTTFNPSFDAIEEIEKMSKPTKKKITGQMDNKTLSKLRKALKRVFSQNSPVYGKLKNIYNRIYKHRK